MDKGSLRYASIRCEDLSVFAPVVEELDGFYWFIETQGGYLPSEEDEEDWQWLEIACEGGPVHVVDIGCFSKVLRRLVLDEWTYLTGVRCSREQLALAAKAYVALKASWLEETRFALVAAWDGLLAVYPDGWWEIVSCDLDLLNALCRSHSSRFLDLAKHQIGMNY